ncbi:ATP-binding protein [Streptomyces griseoincarnatus]
MEVIAPSDDRILRITPTDDPPGLRLAGELDATRHGELSEALSSHVAEEGDVRLDLAGLTFIDLGALSLLTSAMMRIVPTELHAVRAFVADQAKRCGLSADALHNLLVAVTEVATNAIRHGDAPVTLRTWPDDGLICEITDSGNWQPEEFISWQPPESAVDSGFGLWGVGMLCDTVQVRTGSNGTMVRLRSA